MKARNIITTYARHFTLSGVNPIQAQINHVSLEEYLNHTLQVYGF
jgi:hypothetical protein